MSAKIEFTDRYQALGIPYPKSNICKGQCEGIGWVPVHKNTPNDEEGNWHDLWLEQEIKHPEEDGYQFVICPRCKGTRKELDE